MPWPLDIESSGVARRIVTSDGYDETFDHFPDNYGMIKVSPDVDTQELGWAGNVGHNGYPPTFVSHYYANGLTYGVVGADDTRTLIEMPSSRTQVKLFTGGKAAVGQKSLFKINCSAEAYGAPPGGDWMHTPRHRLAPNQLALLGDKHPGGDGILWAALPDNSEQDLTITIPGVKHFSASPTGGDAVQKFTPHLQLTTSTTSANLATVVPEVCVGQRVTFSLQFDEPDAPSLADVKGQWRLPGKYVNYIWQHSTSIPNPQGPPSIVYYGSENYGIDTSLLINTPETGCWFVNQPGGHVSVGLSVKFENGQTASIAAKGDFTVYRPQKVSENMNQDYVTPNQFPNIPSPPLYATNVNGCLSLGDPQGGYARFWAKYNSSYLGTFREAQVVQSYRKAGNDDPVDSGSLWWNDHAFVKGSLSIVSSVDGTAFAMQTDQYPHWPLKAPQTVVNDVFKTYFQFKPDGDGIWLTIGRVNWSWAATATYTGGQWNPPSRITVSNPQYHDDDSFPLWDSEIPPSPY